jgi:hypothetical protein
MVEMQNTLATKLRAMLDSATLESADVFVLVFHVFGIQSCM